MLKEIMLSRGIESADLVPYKAPKLSYAKLYEVGRRVGMELLMGSKDKVFGVLYDTDVDGLYSGYLLTDFFRRLDLEVREYINSGKVHGLVEQGYNWVKNEGITDLYIVDAGSGDEEYITKLATEGVRVIVLDHHPYVPWLSPESNLPVDIINVSEDTSLPKLSGCGVVYRFIESIAELYSMDVKVYEKYVGITVISDVCDITCRENRYYVRELYSYYGRNRKTDPFFNKFDYYGSSRSVFGWSLIPYLNAKIRIGEEQEAMGLMSNMGNAGKLTEIKTDIKRVKKKQKEMVEYLYSVGKLIETPHTIMHLREGYPEMGTLSGLVANKLLSEHGKNAMVLYRNEKTKQWEGSFRGKSYGLTDIVKQGYWAKGHEYACGVRFSGKGIKDFITTFEDEHIWKLGKGNYDKEVDIEGISDSTLLEIARFNEYAMEGTPLPPIMLKLTGISNEDFSTVSSLEGKVIYAVKDKYLIDFNDNITKSEVVVDIVLSSEYPYYQLIMT